MSIKRRRFYYRTELGANTREDATGVTAQPQKEKLKLKMLQKQPSSTDF